MAGPGLLGFVLKRSQAGFFTDAKVRQVKQLPIGLLHAAGQLLQQAFPLVQLAFGIFDLPGNALVG